MFNYYKLSIEYTLKMTYLKKPFTIFIILLSSLIIHAQDAVINIDPARPLTVSRFQIGVTYTGGFWEYGNPVAVHNADNLLINGIAFQNQHIMGWGAGDPEPQPGVYYWKDLDHRVNLMRSINKPGMITFCTAPGWMKGTDDWSMEAAVEDKYDGAFAHLCAAVASRYSDVKYFQVWNELKGYWNNSLNNWDYVRYTNLYNAVYDSVKAVRPDALIGGPYIVIQGDGGVELGKSGRDTYKPISSKDWDVINYWLKNKHGADFFCFDYSLIDYHDTNTYSFSEKMKLTKYFGLVVRQLSQKIDLPIVISEFYGGDDSTDTQFTAANHASCYLHAILNNASLGLVWNPEEGEIDNYLFTSTYYSTGAQPTPHYWVVEGINRYFSKGTQLCYAASSSDDVEVLASAEKTMLVNKTPNLLNVEVNGNTVELFRYDVRFMDTPAVTLVNKTKLNQSPQVKVYYSGPEPYLQINLSSSANVNIRIFDILGRQLDDIDRRLFPGNNAVKIFRGSINLPSGIYFVIITGPGINSARKFYILK